MTTCSKYILEEIRAGIGKGVDTKVLMVIFIFGLLKVI
jgi:hypothetical protein